MKTRLNIYLLLFFLVFCFIRSIVAAAEYHVAKTGSGSTCSQARPCRTIASGLNKISAGDTLTIHAGTYDEYITYDLSPARTTPTGR